MSVYFKHISFNLKVVCFEEKKRVKKGNEKCVYNPCEENFKLNSHTELVCTTEFFTSVP